MDAPLPLDYPSPGPRDPARLPAGFAPLSLVPWAVVAGLVYDRRPVRDFLQVGQGIEVLTGVAWMAAAALSLAWLIVYAHHARPAYVWVCLGLHLLFLCLTICPGVVMIPWYMHWLSGPGA